jgi:hypothetical protein
MPKKPIDKLKPESVVHNASKYRADGRLASIQPEGELGPPSPWLPAAAKKIWREIEGSAPGGLGESDRALMELASVLRLKVSQGKANNSEMVTLLSVMKGLGFIPKHRAPREQGSGGGVAELLRRMQNEKG